MNESCELVEKVSSPYLLSTSDDALKLLSGILSLSAKPKGSVHFSKIEIEKQYNKSLRSFLCIIILRGIGYIYIKRVL